MTNDDIKTLLNQEMARIKDPSKGNGKNTVLTIETKSGKTHVFKTESEVFLSQVTIINEMLKIPVAVSRNTVTTLNTTTNQYENTTTSKYRYFYISCESIDNMWFDFDVINVNPANINTPDSSNTNSGEGE